MLANDREGLHATVRSITERSPNVRVRRLQQGGDDRLLVARPRRSARRLTPRSEACFSCHAAEPPDREAAAGDRTRTLHPRRRCRRWASSSRSRTSRSCSTAACHAHPPEKRLLGVLDVTLTLTPGRADAAPDRLADGRHPAGRAAAGHGRRGRGGAPRRAPADPVRSPRTLQALGSGDYCGALRELDDLRVRLPGRGGQPHGAGDLERANQRAASSGRRRSSGASRRRPPSCGRRRTR